jgi:hypothetical protein
MNKSRDCAPPKRIPETDEEERIARAMEELERDNRSLKDLVIRLSATIVRLVTDRN